MRPGYGIFSEYGPPSGSIFLCCHIASAPGGGIVIAGYDDMVALAENGSLMGSIRWESGYARMPTNQQLPECNITLLQKWIDEGFPE